jgi:hypothetical protein
MRLCGKVAHGVDTVAFEDHSDSGHIADIRFFEDIPPRELFGDPFEIFGISGVSQAVRIDNPSFEIPVRKQMTDKVASYKTASPGNQ